MLEKGNDYLKGNGVSSEQLEQCRKETRKKFNIDSPNLHIHESLFAPGRCLLCEDHGRGSEAARERHFHLFRDLGLRGEEHVERMAEGHCAGLRG